MGTVATAIVEEIKAVESEPLAVINLLDIGPALVRQGFDQHTIVNALFAMQSSKVIELLPGNRLRLMER
jgi:hypothetical protein